MNLYKYHSNPESLHSYQKQMDTNWSVLRDAIQYQNYVPTKQQLKFIGSDYNSALWYAIVHLRERFPEGEKAISTNGAASLSYAKHFFRKSNEGWPPGEEAIATDANYSSQYANYVLDGRFLKGEPIMAKSGYHAIRYAKQVIDGKWPEGEHAIKQDTHNQIDYNNFLKSKGYQYDELI